MTVTPERILDTRDPNNVGLNGPFVSAVSQQLQVTGSIPTATGTKTVVPAGATGVLLNVTPVGATADGFISIRPGDATGAATTSSLNFTTGDILPNAVQVGVPTAGANAGQIDITFDAYGVAGPTTDILIDIVGYTTSAGLQELVADVASKVEYGGTIPPGTTVTGSWDAAPSTDASGSLGFNEITMPARASVPLSSSTVNMAAGTTNGTDNDAACTGTATAPTAPEGKLCFYVGFQTGLTELEAFGSNGDPSLGGAVRVTGAASGDSRYARGSWAYTAPAAGALALGDGATDSDGLGND